MYQNLGRRRSIGKRLDRQLNLDAAVLEVKNLASKIQLSGPLSIVSQVLRKERRRADPRRYSKNVRFIDDGQTESAAGLLG